MNDTLSNTQQSRETIECDVLIVGAGIRRIICSS